MVSFFEIIGIVFIAVMVYLSYLEYKRSKLTKISFTFWLLVWISSIMLIFLSPYINRVLPSLDIIRVLDLYMILAFMFLLAVAFYLFVSVKNTEKRVETLVRRLALSKVK